MSSDLRRALVVPVGAGVAVVAALGLYATLHEPTGRGLAFVDEGSVGDVKRALTVVAVGALVGQLAVGVRLVRADAGASDVGTARQLHRLLGTVAFAATVPVAFHCLWALGADGGDAGVLLHSVFGVVAYGVWTTRALTARLAPAASAAVAGLGLALAIAVLVVAATAT